MAKRRGHGAGGIYQRESDGKWCASVDLGFVHGKRRRKVIYGMTRNEVTDKLKAIHRDQAAGSTSQPAGRQSRHSWNAGLKYPNSATKHAHTKVMIASSYSTLYRILGISCLASSLPSMSKR